MFSDFAKCLKYRIGSGSDFGSGSASKWKVGSGSTTLVRSVQAILFLNYLLIILRCRIT
jgi:hypothetical protein